MANQNGCLCSTISLASAPIWLPLYCLIVPPCRFTRGLYKKYFGPLDEYPGDIPIPHRRKPRRVVSNAELVTKIDSTGNAFEMLRSKPAKDESGFWKLPIEIRWMIWKEFVLLGSDGPIEITLNSRRQSVRKLFSQNSFGSLNPKILRLSRRFYKEGADILYMQNDFRLKGEAALISFTRCIAPSRRAQISVLQFAVCHRMYDPSRHRKSLTFNSKAWVEACEALKSFTGLKTLRISLEFDFGSLRHRALIDHDWSKSMFTYILGPLEKVNVREGSEFLVGYTWPEGLCDAWPAGSFKMMHAEHAF